MAETVSGNDYLKSPVSETYMVEGAIARWKNDSERGEKTLVAPAIYVSINSAPAELAVLVDAARRSGGKIALLPEGEARIERLAERDLQEVEEMLKRHAVYTRSARAWQLLALWQETAPKFVKVMPRDYRRVLEAIEKAEAKGLVGDEALMAAFEANKNDAARVSGN